MLNYNLAIMVCQNNPCSEYLPRVGDASPIVGDEGNTSNMNLIATGYSGGRRHRRHTARKIKRGGLNIHNDSSYVGGRRSHRKSQRKTRRSRRHASRKSRRSYRK